MSNEYITAEVNKIMTDDNLIYPKNLAMSCAWILGNFKGINLKVLNVGGKSSLADYFVLASATNSTQARAMADEIVKQSRAYDNEPLSLEGLTNADWILLDLGDVLVHIFQESSRDVYGLDQVWQDEAEVEEIPQSYYFSDEGQTSETSGSDRDFF